MLLLTRNIRESVMVGEDIEVKILCIKGSKVVLGFKAPSHVVVNREEVHQRMNQQVSNDSQFNGANK